MVSTLILFLVLCDRFGIEVWHSAKASRFRLKTKKYDDKTAKTHFKEEKV